MDTLPMPMILDIEPVEPDNGPVLIEESQATMIMDRENEAPAPLAESVHKCVEAKAEPTKAEALECVEAEAEPTKARVEAEAEPTKAEALVECAEAKAEPTKAEALRECVEAKAEPTKASQTAQVKAKAPPKAVQASASRDSMETKATIFYSAPVVAKHEPTQEVDWTL